MNTNKNISRDQIINELRMVERVDRIMNSNYDVKNLNEEQIEKLLTDNYNLDFLDEPADKFKQIRKNIKENDKYQSKVQR